LIPNLTISSVFKKLNEEILSLAIIKFFMNCSDEKLSILEIISPQPGASM
jgi:hypothetical protein